MKLLRYIILLGISIVSSLSSSAEVSRGNDPTGPSGSSADAGSQKIPNYALIDLGANFRPFQIANSGHVLMQKDDGSSNNYRRWHWGDTLDFAGFHEWWEYEDGVFAPYYTLETMNNKGEIGGGYKAQESDVDGIQFPCGTGTIMATYYYNYWRAVIIDEDGVSSVQALPDIPHSVSEDSGTYTITSLNDNGDYILSSVPIAVEFDGQGFHGQPMGNLTHVYTDSAYRQFGYTNLKTIRPLSSSCSLSLQYSGTQLYNLIISNEGRIAGRGVKSIGWSIIYWFTGGTISFNFIDSIENEVPYRPIAFNQNGLLLASLNQASILIEDDVTSSVPDMGFAFAMTSPDSGESLMLISGSHVAIQKTDPETGDLVPMAAGSDAFTVISAEDLLHQPDSDGLPTINSEWSSPELLGISDNGSFIIAEAQKGGDSHAVLLLKGDLDIDSNNTNGSNLPDRSAAEEALEDDPEATGKLIGVNNGDRNFNNIPDYADGFDGNTLEGVEFTKLVLEVPDGISIDRLKVKLIYSASDPASIDIETESCGSCDNGGDSLWTTRDGKIYRLPTGNMRIWLKDGSEARNSASVVSEGDFIPSDTEIPFEKLNGDTTERTVTLYVEGVIPSNFPGEDTIKLVLGIDSGGSVYYFDADQVRVTVTDVTFKGASGDGFLARDDYIFGSADFSFSASYSDPASLVIYSMKEGGNMEVSTLTLPPAPQMMDEVIEYSLGERGHAPLPVVSASVSPDSSSGVTQVVSVTAPEAEGFSYLDAIAGRNSIGNVPAGSAGVVVFAERKLSVGVKRINQRYNDVNFQDFDAPEFTAADEQALEDYLNNQVYHQANVVWDVAYLGDLGVDYDTNRNGKLNFSTPAIPGEADIIRLAANDTGYDYMLYIVKEIDGVGGFVQSLGSRHAFTMGSGSSDSALRLAAHELGHALGLPHPFQYNLSGNGFPFANDYDPHNLMNYTDGVKIRFNQWIFINSLNSIND